MIHYYGIPTPAASGGLIVRYSNDKKPKGNITDLPPRLDLARLSPGGFTWGTDDKGRFVGQGSAQLALAIVAHALGDEGRAVKVYQRFKHRALKDLKADQPWSMTQDEVLSIVDQIVAADPEVQKIARSVGKDITRGETDTGPGVDPNKGGIQWDTDEHGNRIRRRGED